MFDPGKPDGTNDTLKIGISNDGKPSLDHFYKVPARCGIAVKLEKIKQSKLKIDLVPKFVIFGHLTQIIYTSIFLWSMYIRLLDPFCRK